jgi:DNA topoisomerase VI subunit B
VLSGTKYGLKQTRGKFGLGAKMVSVLLCVYIWQQLFLYVNVSKISNLYL